MPKETQPGLEVEYASATPEVAGLTDPRDLLFDTSHVANNLKQRSVRGGITTLGAQGGRFILQFASTAALARLLTQADFGLVAMVAVVTNFAAMFKDAGLAAATVQRKHITHAQVSTLFWINLALGAAIAGLVAASGPLLAWVYGEPRLVWLTAVLGGLTVFSGVGVQHAAILRRRMEFGKIAVAEIGGMAAGSVTGVALAYYGFGYWSLAAMIGASLAATSLLNILMCRWVPSLPRRGTGVRSMLAFGGGVTGFGFLNYFARNGDNFLIGVRWGEVPLALYNRSYNLMTAPLMQVNRPAASVAVPMLSRVADDPERFRRAYVKVARLLCLIGMPMIAVGASLADYIVLIALGSDWMASARIFVLLSIAGVVQPFLATLGWLYESTGRGRDMFVWGIISTAIIVTSFLIGLPFGAEGVALAYGIGQITLVAPLAIHFAIRNCAVTWGDVAKAVMVPAGISILLAGATVGIRVVSGLKFLEPGDISTSDGAANPSQVPAERSSQGE